METILKNSRRHASTSAKFLRNTQVTHTHTNTGVYD